MAIQYMARKDTDRTNTMISGIPMVLGLPYVYVYVAFVASNPNHGPSSDAVATPGSSKSKAQPQYVLVDSKKALYKPQTPSKEPSTPSEGLSIGTRYVVLWSPADDD